MTDNQPAPPPRPQRRDPYRLTGETFDGRYQLEEYAGMGSFGAVYRAKATRVGRTVAVKILKPDLGEDETAGARELFQREALTAGRLSHPHIVAVIDVGEHEGFAYMVMEWLDGRTLEQEMRGRAPFTPEETAALLAQIADGLQHAHDAGVIHRDIKPSNIHLGTKERPFVKMLDFGIAKVITSSTAVAASRIAGTVSYMSPEQITGSVINHRSDIYSLGIVLYQMLTGSLPFVGESQGHIIQQHIAAPPPPLTSARPDLPHALSGVVQRALAKTPEERQRSARELSLEFSAALRPSNQPTQVYTPPAERRAPQENLGRQGGDLPETQVIPEHRNHPPLQPPGPAADPRYSQTTARGWGGSQNLYGPPPRGDELPPTEVVPPENRAWQQPPREQPPPQRAPATSPATPVFRQTTETQGGGLIPVIISAAAGTALFFFLNMIRFRNYSDYPTYYGHRDVALPILGFVLGLAVSGFFVPGTWSIKPGRWINALIAHAGAGAGLMMFGHAFGEPDFSLVLALTGFIIGLFICIVRIVARMLMRRAAR
jgi:serine/threonine protein kinase